MDKDELDDIRKDDASECTGIGTSVDFSAADMAVTAVSADSPADLAGVDPGDTIASIDSATIVGMRLRDISRRMRDVLGSALEIGFRRGSSGAVRTIAVQRAAFPARPSSGCACWKTGWRGST